MSSGPTHKEPGSTRSDTHHSTTEVKTTVTDNRGNNPRSHSSSQSRSHSHSHFSPIGGKRNSKAHLPSSDDGGHQSSEETSKKAGSALSLTHHTTTETRTTVAENSPIPILPIPILVPLLMEAEPTYLYLKVVVKVNLQATAVVTPHLL